MTSDPLRYVRFRMNEQENAKHQFHLWLSGMTVYAAWHRPDLAARCSANAIGWASR